MQQLSSLNYAYINRQTPVQNATQPVLCPEVPNAAEKKSAKKKLALALAGLAALSAAGLLIYSGRAQKAAPAVDNLTQPVFKKLGNGRISMTSTINGVESTIELPEFLYHITSEKNMPSILKDGVLHKSTTEQLNGTYLLDSENFIHHYRDLKNHDLINGIFNQATKKARGKAPLSNESVCIIKVPTEELLTQGKLRVRKQEDFFFFQNEVAKYTSKTGKKMSARGMCDALNRDELRQKLADSGMEQKAIDDFMRDMEQKLHIGYTVHKAFTEGLEHKGPIEYIYNNDLDFSKLNITYNTVQLKDIIARSPKGREFVDASKLPQIFNF